MCSRKKEDLEPFLMEAYLYAKQRFMDNSFHFKPFLTCTHRSIEEQEELFSHGREDKKPVVTNCDGVSKKSKHNYYPSRAFDIAFLRIGSRELSWDVYLFKLFNKYVQQYCNMVGGKIKWGGEFKSFTDNPYYELRKRPIYEIT